MSKKLKPQNGCASRYARTYTENARLSNVYLYDNTAESVKLDSQLPYRDEKDRPYWLDNDWIEQYWVLRFMY